jgi:hypothetical protein
MKNFTKNTLEQFDKKFSEKITFINYCLSEGVEMLDKQELKDFITFTILSYQEMIQETIKKELLNRMMKYDSKDGYSTLHDEILEKVSNDVDDILKLLSNNEE